jgi:hypothetical protein
MHTIPCSNSPQSSESQQGRVQNEPGLLTPIFSSARQSNPASQGIDSPQASPSWPGSGGLPAAPPLPAPPCPAPPSPAAPPAELFPACPPSPATPAFPAFPAAPAWPASPLPPPKTPASPARPASPACPPSAPPWPAAAPPSPLPAPPSPPEPASPPEPPEPPEGPGHSPIWQGWQRPSQQTCAGGHTGEPTKPSRVQDTSSRVAGIASWHAASKPSTVTPEERRTHRNQGERGWCAITEGQATPREGARASL